MLGESTAIAAIGLAKRYRRHEALRGVDLVVETGETVAILGPNGAGKTTLVEILEGYVSADGGEARVLGCDPRRGGRALKARLGIVLQSCAVEPYLTVTEVLRQRAAWYPTSLPVDEVLAVVGLEREATRRVRQLSGGQQRRLDLGLALVGDPELLFLDEPTTGFDLLARRGAWDAVRTLSAAGKTVIVTTHALDEAQALADRVVVLVAGRVVADGAPAALAGRARGPVRIEFRLTMPPVDLPVPVDVVEGVLTLTVASDDLTVVIHRLTRWATDQAVDLVDLAIVRPTLEDAYLHIIGEHQ